MRQLKQRTPEVLTLRTLARKFAWAEGFSGFTNATPVWIVPGDQAPNMQGEGWHFRTHGGTRITYPKAYEKVGWSNMVYCHSTLRLVVGENWRPTNADI